MVSEGSLDLHKEMKLSRSGLNESQHKKHCFLFLMILKDKNSVLKNITTVSLVHVKKSIIP